MIVQFLIDVACTIASWLVGLLPTIDPPSWVTDANGTLASVLGSVASLGVWAPIPLVVVVASTVLACLGIGLGIKLVRIVASFLLAGGGSAG